MRSFAFLFAFLLLLAPQPDARAQQHAASAADGPAVFTNTSSFSGVQGRNGWSYAAVLFSGTSDLSQNQRLLNYDDKTSTWGIDAPGHLNLITANQQSMTEGYAWFSLRYWTANKSYKTVKVEATLHAIATAAVCLYFVDARTHRTNRLDGTTSDRKATASTPEDVSLSYTLTDVQPGDRVYFALQNWGNESTGSGVMQTWDQKITANPELTAADRPVWNADAHRPLPPLHGHVSAISLDGKTLSVATTWNRLVTGKMWVGFEQEGALYAASVLPLAPGSSQNLCMPLPDNLPGGRLVLQCVPIGQAVAESADGVLDAPRSSASAGARPLSWGLYRDPDLITHPWSVSGGGLMSWDGEPFIPMGGMVNVPSSWITKAGEADQAGGPWNSAANERRRFALLKSYGLRDVYFNGFFRSANPNALAGAVAVAEDEGMRYGIEPGTPLSPDFVDLGFASNSPPILVAPHQVKAEIRVPCDVSALRPAQRCVWALVSSSGKVLQSGAGVMAVEEPKKRPAKDAPPGKDLVLAVTISGAGLAGGRLIYSPETVMSVNDPDGYYSGINQYVANVKQVYGSLPLGSGFRLWIDPFENELFSAANQVCSSPKFLDGYQDWLVKKYGTLGALNAAWGLRTPASPTGIAEAAHLVPLTVGNSSIVWINPQTGRTATSSDAGTEGLRDLALYRGAVAQRMCILAADTLKQIANVPVIFKHNTWFSDWFVNPQKAGGFDGNGYEAYCYGDSLAFHNSLVPFAESLSSARQQWDLVTETSPAAFDGQKDYVGYLDRYQMLDDLDQLLKFGAKGIYTFGFVFDPGSSFQVTELIRDPRQLEWLATYGKTLAAASSKLAAYQPEVYGWYPAYLRERDLVRPKDGGIFGPVAPQYAMSGMYLGVASQIRMAPDGRWIVPALRPDAAWKGLLAADPLMTPTEKAAVAHVHTGELVYRLGGVAASSRQSVAPLNGFTASGIGVIAAQPHGQTLDEFRRAVLGYRVFQTEDLNGQTLPDGRLMVWTCVEKTAATVRLPATTAATSVAGSPVALAPGPSGDETLTLVRQPYVKQEKNLPSYLTSGYFYPDNGQPEVAILSGVTVEQILALNTPAWQRWLPGAVPAANVAVWKEAEDFTETTFVEPRIEGYSRYSGDTAVGINTDFDPPAGANFHASYEIETSGAATRFWLRRQTQTNMDVEVSIDGARIGVIPAGGLNAVDTMDLGVWNAGTGENGLKVGWFPISLASPLTKGRHRVLLVARLASGSQQRASDTKLLGGAAELLAKKDASTRKLQTLQLDVFMLTR